MNFMINLIFCILPITLANMHEEELHEMAKAIMQNLQKDYIPSEGSSSGVHNAPLHHLISDNLGKQSVVNSIFGNTTNLKVSVGVAGIRFVSVQYNDKVINITTKFGVGAAAVYKITDEEESNKIEDSSYDEIDSLIEPLSKLYTDTSAANANETSVLLGQKAKFGIKIKADQKNAKEINIKVDHGFIVSAKTNVTKGYH